MASRRQLRRRLARWLAECDPETCARKPRWPSQAAAEAEARLARDRIRGQAAAGQAPVRAYRCPVCRGWHVGHASAELRRLLPAGA